MIYRIDMLPEEDINPINGMKYTDKWMAFVLTYGTERQIMVGKGKEGVYSIRLSKLLNDEWYLSVGDFIGYCEANGLNGILEMSENDFELAKKAYNGHCYNEPLLRKNESKVLIHSTTSECWESILRDGQLKSWARLKREVSEWEDEPIGFKLGDIAEFGNYIMFGGDVSGEIVVSSKLSGDINMDVNAEYHTGARLYFDAEKMARDGLLIRDGAHIKVRDTLPLEPYLIWVATWEKLGMKSPISTPKVFAQTADKQFRDEKYSNTVIRNR